MGPLRRNPQSIRAKEIKLDSKAVSVKLMMSQNPEGQLISEYLFDFSNLPKNQQKIWQISALESKKWSNQ